MKNKIKRNIFFRFVASLFIFYSLTTFASLNIEQSYSPGKEVFAVDPWHGLVTQMYVNGLTIAIIENDYLDVTVSHDGGKTWKRDDVYAMATALFGIGENIYSAYVPSGGPQIYHSADNGNTWTKIPMPSQNNFLPSSLAADSTGQIIAGLDEGERGVFVTTDAGKTWNQYLAESYSLGKIAISNNKIYVNTVNATNLFDDGLHVSSDFGKSWVNIDPIKGDHYCNNKSMFSVEDNTIYLLAQNNSNCSLSDLYVSKDGGGTWQFLKSFSAARYIHSEKQVIAIATSNAGIYTSHDGGLTWDHASTNEGLDSMAVNNVYVNGKIYVGTP